MDIEKYIEEDDRLVMKLDEIRSRNGLGDVFNEGELFVRNEKDYKEYLLTEKELEALRDMAERVFGIANNRVATIRGLVKFVRYMIKNEGRG